MITRRDILKGMCAVTAGAGLSYTDKANGAPLAIVKADIDIEGLDIKPGRMWLRPKPTPVRYMWLTQEVIDDIGIRPEQIVKELDSVGLFLVDTLA